jgi:hypothetical protein
MSIMKRVGAIAVIALCLAGGVATSGAGGPVAAAQTPGIGAGGEFHPLGPVRVFDSRPESSVNDTAPLGKKPMTLEGADFRVKLAGVGGLPASPTEILAVVANVTVVEPDQAGWLAVRPTGSSAGTSALVNFAAGRNVPNLAFVGVGADGSMTVKLRSVGSAHVVVDVFGWISTSSVAQRGARLVTTGPARLFDTRNSGSPLRADQTLPLQVRGAASYSPVINPVVPNSPSVTAVLVSIAAINNRPGSASTYLSATPLPVAPGSTSATANLNVVAGQIKTGMAIVPIGPDGRIHIRNHAGETDLAVDVFGYFEVRPDDSRTGRIVPLDAPFRALDTREPAFGNLPLGSGTAEEWSLRSFAESVTVPSGAGRASLGNQSALLGNLTATDLRRTVPSSQVSSYLTGFPGAVDRPLVANLNLGEGEVVPNMSLLSYGAPGHDYRVKIYNHAGSVHYVLDVYAVVLAD